MEGLIDCLDATKWKEIPVAEKSGDFIEFHINRSHKQVDATTICYMVENDDIDAKKITLFHCKKDPFKTVQQCEFRLGGDDGLQITGLDLDGDVVVLQ